MAGVSLGWCQTYSEKEPPLPLLPSPLPPAPELLSTKGFLVSSAEWSVDERSTALTERERESERSQHCFCGYYWFATFAEQMFSCILTC